MGRGRKGNSTRDVRRRIRSKEDSDEDYVVENDTNDSDDDLEDVGNSLDELTSEESFGGFVDSGKEDEEEEDTEVVRPKKRKISLKNGKTRPKTVRKRKRVSSKEDEDKDYADDVDDEEYYEDENEEFISDENDDYLDEEEELTLIRRNTNNVKAKQVKRNVQRRCSGRGQKRRKSKVLCKPMKNKGMRSKRLKKKGKWEYVDKDNRDFNKNGSVVGETSRKTLSVKRRKYAVYSDSDFVPSGLSDCEYTISEEEREQVREASELFEVKSSLRGSSSVKRIFEDEGFCQQREPLHRKGKEKVKKIMPDKAKHVCGICLTEEDNRRLRGMLNCCSHYFCFTCIMEWSKVESRCPLCKQRFRTITKNGRSTPGPDLRNVVIQVPKRDQVYQPSEEEIRSFIDPYENVMCTVSHEGGEDGLMLLCDLCDSPTHTYCVGLGQQVPEGNWYCDDCRPVALGSSSSPTQNSLLDQTTSSNNIISRPSPIRTFESLDPILESSPRVAFTQGLGNLSSPRFPAGGVQVASPVYGSGVPTVSNRREIHRRIQSIISITRMNHMSGRIGGFSAVNLRSDLSNPQSDQAIQSSRIQEIGASQQTFFEGRLQANDYPSSSVQYSDSVSLRPSHFCGQVVRDSIVATAHQPTNLTLWPRLGGIDLVAGCNELHCNHRSSIASHGNLSPPAVGEFYTEMEQLKSMVRSHLKSLSRDIELGQDIFNDIENSSTKTILAACGRETSDNDCYTVHRPLTCAHVDKVPVGQKSMMENLCFSCFDSFVRDVVDKILDTKRSPWLRLSL